MVDTQHPSWLVSAPLRVVDLEPGDRRWARFIAARPEALPYHHPSWFQVLRRAFGYRSAALGCVDGTGDLVGVLPLVEKRSLLAGVHLASLPHTPVAGPLATSREGLRALLVAAAMRAEHAGCWLQLKASGPELDGMIPGLSRVRWNPSYVLELPSNPQDLRFGSSRNDARIRWAARKAARLGVTLRAASSVDDFRAWYRLYLETMRQHATPPRPFRFFHLMWEILGPEDRLRLLLAERKIDGRAHLLAGSVFLRNGGTVIYAFNGCDQSQLGFRPNDAIHLTAITDACGNGFRTYDFGEVMDGDFGLAQFKGKWGARKVELYRYHYPRHREVERGVLAAGRLRNTAQWTWRRLPLPVTAGLGGWIYRRL